MFEQLLHRSCSGNRFNRSTSTLLRPTKVRHAPCFTHDWWYTSQPRPNPARHAAPPRPPMIRVRRWRTPKTPQLAKEGSMCVLDLILDLSPLLFSWWVALRRSSSRASATSTIAPQHSTRLAPRRISVDSITISSRQSTRTTDRDAVRGGRLRHSMEACRQAARAAAQQRRGACSTTSQR